ncbi:serine hydrolase FSH [Whalleya microplaca]|nr:serine hydrolase FSH [Whalleya microplaca]
MAPSKTLPVIFCLHGHGTNATIYRHQARNIVQVLKPKFRFVFVESPIETTQAGTGVLPIFADVKPYRRWHHDENVIGSFDVTADDIEQERHRVRDTLAEHIERERPVGIMAFSQGTRVANALCLDRELGAHIKFIVNICGFSGLLPLTSELEHRTLDLPSIHVQGSADPWAVKAARFSKGYFNQACATTIKFRGGHEVPTGLGEVVKIADAMIAAYNSSKTF